MLWFPRMIMVSREWAGNIRSFLRRTPWQGVVFPYREKYRWIAEMEHPDNSTTFVEIDFETNSIELGFERRRGQMAFTAGKRIRIENFENFVQLFNASDNRQ